MSATAETRLDVAPGEWVIFDGSPAVEVVATDERGALVKLPAGQTRILWSQPGLRRAEDHEIAAAMGDEPAAVPFVPPGSNGTEPECSATNTARAVLSLPVADIHPNRNQPRQAFGGDGIAALSESMRQHGLLQPVAVRKVTFGFELIHGERRLRAAKALGWTHIDAIQLAEMRGATETDASALLKALSENEQREDLNELERARAYARLTELNWTQAEIATFTGRSRPAVANAMRLLSLPDDVQDRIRRGELTAAHGVALCGLEDAEAQGRLAAAAVDHHWTSKELESRVRTAREEAHRQKRETERQAERQREVQERTTRTVTTFASEGVSTGTAPTADAPPAPRPEGLPHVNDLKSPWLQLPMRPPEGCSAKCPCRVEAVSNAGSLVQCCTDPERLRGLQVAQVEGEREARRAEADAVLEPLVARMKDCAMGCREPALNAREVALVAANFIGVYGTGGLDQAGESLGIDVSECPDLGSGEPWDLTDWLATLPVEQILPLAILASIHEEGNDYAREGREMEFAAWVGGGDDA